MENDAYWTYFRFTKREKKDEIECIICENTVSNEYQIKRNHIENHYSQKTTDLMFYKHKNWVFKYAKLKEDIAKCTICEATINYQLHLENLKLHMSTHQTDQKRIQQEEIFWKLQTKKHSWLQKCYTDAGDFRAQCKFCDCNETYIKHEQFIEHIKQAHNNVHDFEQCNPSKNADQWKYVRYTTNDIGTEETKVECMICQEMVSLPHLNHSAEKLESYSQHWALKYARQDECFAKCTICKDKVDFEFDMDNLIHHMLLLHDEEWENIDQNDLEQGTAHDQAGPSTSHAN
nr:PREDICTED: uncharacterized protein LOC105675892 [Linepithema humile]